MVPALLIALVCAGWWWREWIADWVGWQLAARAAWRHEMPQLPATLAANGERAQELAENPDYVVDADGIAVYHPASLRRLAAYDWRMEHIEWPVLLGPGSDVPPISFMGVLRRPDGEERLVVVSGGTANALSLLRGVTVLVLPPPSMRGSERFLGVQQGAFMRTGQSVRAVLHMGRRDPADDGRIIIPFSVFGHAHGRPTATGRILLTLRDDDTLAAAVESYQPDQPGYRLELGTEQLAMPALVPLPASRSPWRSQSVAIQSLRALPSPTPFEW